MQVSEMEGRAIKMERQPAASYAFPIMGEERVQAPQSQGTSVCLTPILWSSGLKSMTT